MNAAAYVLERARSRPESVALFEPRRRDTGNRDDYEAYTNRDLDRASDEIDRSLRGIGVAMGVRTALMVRPGFDLFTLTLALLKLGAIPVMVDPGSGLRRLGACLEEAEPEVFIGIPLAHAALVLFGWGCRSLRTHVTLGRHGCWGGETLAKVRERGQGGAAFEIADTSGDDEAAILFASGSTGPPKGVMYRHSNFAAQIEAIREFGQIGPGEVDLPISPPLGAL